MVVASKCTFHKRGFGLKANHSVSIAIGSRVTRRNDSTLALASRPLSVALVSLRPPAAAGFPWCSDTANPKVSLPGPPFPLPFTAIRRFLLSAAGELESSSGAPCGLLTSSRRAAQMEHRPESDRPLKRVKYQQHDNDTIPVNIAAAYLRDSNNINRHLATGVPLFDNPIELSVGLTSPSQVPFNLATEFECCWGPTFSGKETSLLPRIRRLFPAFLPLVPHSRLY